MTTTILIWENDENGTPCLHCNSIGFTVAGRQTPSFILSVLPGVAGLPCGREAAKGKRWLKLLGNAYQLQKFRPACYTNYVNGYEMAASVALELLRDLADHADLRVEYDERKIEAKFRSKTLTVEDMGWMETEYKPSTITQGTFF